jgi:prepilin-type processing-associated H-X9-DG protein
MPFVEQDSLFKALDLTRRDYFNTQTPDSPGAKVVRLYLCPSDYVPEETFQYGTYHFAANSYFGNAGSWAWPVDKAAKNGFDGVLYYNSSVRINMITDGTSNTILAGERYSLDPGVQDTNLANWRGWAWTNENSAGDILCDSRYAINSTYAEIVTYGFTVDERKTTFGSGHAGNGANFVLCDGSVRFISRAVAASGGDVTVLHRLCTINGGEVIPSLD